MTETHVRKKPSEFNDHQSLLRDEKRFVMVSESDGGGDLKIESSGTEFFLNLKWMNSKEAARYLRVSVGQLRNLIQSGDLKVYHLKNRLRFLRTDLDRLIS